MLLGPLRAIVIIPKTHSKTPETTSGQIKDVRPLAAGTKDRSKELKPRNTNTHERMRRACCLSPLPLFCGMPLGLHNRIEGSFLRAPLIRCSDPTPCKNPTIRSVVRITAPRNVIQSRKSEFFLARVTFKETNLFVLPCQLIVK